MTDTQSKTCRSCQVNKPLSGFYKSNTSKIGYASECKLCAKVRLYNYSQAHPEKRREWTIKTRAKIKLDVCTHYGGGEAQCVRCEEVRLACLSIDHIEGGGRKHREELRRQGIEFYRWLKHQGYPEGYQTLCMNCQFVKRMEKNEYFSTYYL